jgi:hypothetical protein
MEKMGIEEVKQVVKMGLAMGELVDALSDGVGISDIKPLIKAGVAVKPGIDAVKSGKVVPELKDLDDAEKVELKQFVKDNFDISDDVIEVQIETGIGIAVDLCDLLKSV